MKKRLTQAERVARLWRETVYQAVRDIRLSHEASELERDLARKWVFSDSTHHRSFLWACKQAGLDPDEVRAEVPK